MNEGVGVLSCLIYVRSMIRFDSLALLAVDVHKDGRALRER